MAFRVADVGKSVEFYKTLGFEESFGFADPGKPKVAYIKVNDHQFIELYGRARASDASGLLHICYEAADIQALWREYTNRGLKLRPPQKARAGNLLFATYDPDGNVVEFTQYLPGSLHFEDRGKHLGPQRISLRIMGAAEPAKDVAAEGAFYQEKLGFTETTPGLRLLLPGSSNQEVDLDSAAQAEPAQLFFGVTDVRRAADELRRRGLPAQRERGLARVADPDGAVLVFRKAR